MALKYNSENYLISSKIKFYSEQSSLRYLPKWQGGSAWTDPGRSGKLHFPSSLKACVLSQQEVQVLWIEIATLHVFRGAPFRSSPPSHLDNMRVAFFNSGFVFNISAFGPATTPRHSWTSSLVVYLLQRHLPSVSYDPSSYCYSSSQPPGRQPGRVSVDVSAKINRWTEAKNNNNTITDSNIYSF